MRFSETFLGALEIARRPAAATVARFVPSLSVRPWLLMLYQVIRATTPVLRYAHRASNSDELAEFFRKKLMEERGHDDMLLTDLVHLGMGKKAAQSAPVNPYVAEMVGRQYYAIDFIHPSVYLGFIGLLEGFPPTLEQVEGFQSLSGLPKAAFSTLRLHAKADVGHWEELAGVLDAQPAERQPDILANAVRCAQLQAHALSMILEAQI